MYTLRTITKEQLETNFYLGKSYKVVKKDLCPDEFESIFNDIMTGVFIPDSQSVVGFVVSENEKPRAILSGDFNFIVTDLGKTFSNLSVS